MRCTLVLLAMAAVPSLAQAESDDIVSRPLVLDARQVAADLVTRSTSRQAALEADVRRTRRVVRRDGSLDDRDRSLGPERESFCAGRELRMCGTRPSVVTSPTTEVVWTRDGALWRARSPSRRACARSSASSTRGSRRSPSARSCGGPAVATPSRATHLQLGVANTDETAPPCSCRSCSRSSPRAAGIALRTRVELGPRGRARRLAHPAGRGGARARDVTPRPRGDARVRGLFGPRTRRRRALFLTVGWR
jgi:hypothetical protein